MTFWNLSLTLVYISITLIGTCSSESSAVSPPGAAVGVCCSSRLPSVGRNGVLIVYTRLQETGREEQTASTNLKQGSEHFKIVEVTALYRCLSVVIRCHRSSLPDSPWRACVARRGLCTDSLLSAPLPSGDVGSRHGVFRQNVWSSRSPSPHGVSWRTAQRTQHR